MRQREGSDQTIKHSLWLLSHVVAEGKLRDIFPKVLAGHMDMGSANAVLEPRPIALDTVHMNVATNIFSATMVDGEVDIWRLV